MPYGQYATDSAPSPVFKTGVFERIKKIETRAGTLKYQHIKAEDIITFVCEKDRFQKKIKKVSIFKTISALTKKYKPLEINPQCTTLKALTAMYMSFPHYREKIKQYGLVAFKLK